MLRQPYELCFFVWIVTSIIATSIHVIAIELGRKTYPQKHNFFFSFFFGSKSTTKN